MRRIFLAVLLCFVSVAPAFALADVRKLSDPRQEARAVALQKELRCLVCQGQSLDESDAPLAADLRRLIRARISAGDSDEQVEQYLVARYGDFILLKPPFETSTLVLWLTPAIVLLAGGAAAVWRRPWVSESRATMIATPSPTPRAVSAVRPRRRVRLVRTRPSN